MKVERHVSKGVIWLVFAGLMICSLSLLYFGTIHRFSYASKYENYSEVAGRLNSLQEYENEDTDSEGNTYDYYTYAAEIEYIVDGCEFPYKSRVMPTREPLKTLKAPYMARNPMK